MGTVQEVVESLKIPHFLRDILFLMGGILIIALLYISFQDGSFQDRATLLYRVFTTDINILAYIVIASLSYVIGRAFDIFADFFYDSIRFLVNITFGKRHVDESFKDIFCKEWRRFFTGNLKMNSYKKGTKASSGLNHVLVLNYYNSNQALALEHERIIITDIFCSHLICISIILTWQFSWWWTILLFVSLLKKHQNIRVHASRGSDIRKVIKDKEALPF